MYPNFSKLFFFHVCYIYLKKGNYEKTIIGKHEPIRNQKHY